MNVISDPCKITGRILVEFSEFYQLVIIRSIWKCSVYLFKEKKRLPIEQTVVYGIVENSMIQLLITAK